MRRTSAYAAMTKDEPQLSIRTFNVAVIPVSLAGPEAENILHIVQTVRAADDPEGRADRPAGKIVPAVGAVDEFEPLPQGAEDHRMLPDDVAGPEGLDSDLRTRPLPAPPSATVDADLVEVPARTFGNHLRHLQGCTARGVFLQAVMGLHNLHIVVVPEDPGGVGEDLEQHIDADAHVGGQGAADGAGQ